MRSTRGPLPAAETLTVETLRPDGRRQTFAFLRNGDALDSPR